MTVKQYPTDWYLGHALDNLNKLAGLTGQDEWGEYPLGEELGELIEDTQRLIAGAIETKDEES